MKRGAGEPNSQMGKSYANRALPRANQCSPSALPRDWLAGEGGGARAPRHPGPPRASTRSPVYPRASLLRTPAALPALHSREPRESARRCVSQTARRRCAFLSPSPFSPRSFRPKSDD